jgi:Kef-type K+ transport system membrane component KefB/Trk K+ transport system NAD-binding subunit
MVETLITDIGVFIVAATFLALIARCFKQPLIAGYILAGIIIGPDVLGLVQNTEIIRLFSELGVAFLLFIVGLEMDFSRLREVRNVVLGVALAESLLFFGLGFWLSYLFFGFGSLTSVYIGLFIAFNSTAVLVKMLSESTEIDTLHGRIIVGILIIQDILVVLAISVLSTLNNPSFNLLISSLLTGAGLLALAVVLSKYIIPFAFDQIEDSHELIFLVSITTLFLFVGLSQHSGLSTAVGGFLAGVALTAFPYNVEIAERAHSMRDFFVTIFFVSLGMIADLNSLYDMLIPFFILASIVILIKPVFVNILTSLFQYGKKTSFQTGLSLSQTSEFSLVIALIGLEMGHISEGVFSTAAALLVLSIVTTSYFLKYHDAIYAYVEEFLLEFQGARYEEESVELSNHVVVCGAHIKGKKILQFLAEQEANVVVIDYDPEVVQQVEDYGFTPIYGNIEDPEVLERANIAEATTVVSTVPGEDANRFLVRHVKDHNPDAMIIVSANDMESALLMYSEGADYVLYPKMLASQEAADLIRKIYHDGDSLNEIRRSHIEELEADIEEEILDRFEPEFIKQLKTFAQRGRDEE